MFSVLDNIKWNSYIEVEKSFLDIIGINKKNHM
jgi:hypothetical protein